MSNKVLLQKSKLSELTLDQIAEDVSSKVSVSSYKILKNQNIIIFDGEDQDTLYTEIKALEHGRVLKDHSNFTLNASRSTIAPGTSTRYWHLDAITRLDYNHLTGNNGTFSTINNGEDIDIYIVDSGVQGATRPSGNGAALHPELYDPDYITDLNGGLEQAFYRVYQLPLTLYDPGTTNDNDPQSTGSIGADGHGTNCAILAAGVYAGVANKARVYSVRVSDDAGAIYLSQMVSAYEAIYKHNDPNDADFKGNELDGNTRARPAVVNVSIGAVAPHPLAPYIDRNEDLGFQAGNTNEILDDGEYLLSSQYGVALCRSAGNGMEFNSPDEGGDIFYGPQNTKITYGSRNAGQASILDPEITFAPEWNGLQESDKFVVGATKINGTTGKQTFADFTNYGDAVTCYAPGQGLLCPAYNWTSNSDYTATHYTISGTSFSSPIMAGMVAVWKQINDAPFAGQGQHLASLAAEKKYRFTDYTNATAILSEPAGSFQNPTNVSSGSAITRYLTSSNSSTWYPISTTGGTNQLKIQLNSALWTALNPQQNDIWEFEFPRVETPGVVDPSTGIGSLKTEDVIHLGERRDYEVTVQAGKFYLARVLDGLAGPASQAPVLTLEDGVVYRFYQSDASNLTHPLGISNVQDGTHGGGSDFTQYVQGLPGAPVDPTNRYRLNLRYFRDQGAGAEEISKTDYDAAAGSGVSCWIEWINPTGQTHPKVDSNVYAGTYYYYCVNHAGMGSTINSSAAQSTADIAGIDLLQFCSKWRTISAVDAVNYTVTFTADQTATGSEVGGGGAFSQCDELTDTGSWPRWPIRFTKITGTWFENDAVYEWITNHPTVVYPFTKYSGGSFAPGEFYAQLESEEGNADGALVQYFPIPKGRLVREGIAGGAEQEAIAKHSGPRYGHGDPQDVRTYLPMPVGQSSLTFDGGQGVYFPFVDLVGTWNIPAGSIGSYINGESDSQTINVQTVTTFAGDVIAPADRSEEFELVSGGTNSPFTQVGSVYTFTDSGFQFDASTGVFSGTATSQAQAINYQFTIKENTSGSTSTYNFSIDSAPVVSSITIVSQPPTSFTGDGSFPVDQGTIQISVNAVDSLSTPITYQWQEAADAAAVSSGTWSDVTDTNGFSGSQSATLTVPDKLENKGKYYRCALDTITAPSTVYTNTSLANIDLVVTCKALWNNVLSVYASGSLALVEIDASVSDGSTPTLVASYDKTRYTETFLETNIPETQYALEYAGYNGNTGFPTYIVRLGENNYNTNTYLDYKSDDSVYIKITASSQGYSQDAVTLFTQQIVPCISVIDENSNQNQTQVNTDWTDFRTAWPDRPFHVLHAKNQAGTAWDGLTLPTNATQGVDYEYYQIERDPSTPLTSFTGTYDWFTLTGCDSLPSGATVALFIDDSGSLNVADVEDQLGEFEADCAANNISIVRLYNANEEFIKPFITTLTVTEPDPFAGPFVVDKAYTIASDLSTSLSIPKATNYALSTAFGVANNTGISAAEYVWYYKQSAEQVYTKLINGNLSALPWYVSGYGTSTLNVNFVDDTYDGMSFFVVAYNDFTGTSGGDDADNIAKYSGISSSIGVVNVTPFTVSDVTNPPGVTDPNDTLSKTSATFSSSEYVITLESDNLPDPAEYGFFPNTTNLNSVSDQTFIHSIRYRGGTNSSALTPVTSGALGLTANGTPLYSSKLFSNLEGDSGAAAGLAPAGFNWNIGMFLANYGADVAGGYPDSTNTYRYHTGTFYTSGNWDGVSRSNTYYRTGNYNGDFLRHADGHSKIIGIAFDGHPIYGTWGYTNDFDSTSGISRMTSSYATYASEQTGRTYTYAQYPAGSFVEDYQYIAASGKLDRSNGRYCVTPEFPNGTYAYFLSTDSSNNSTYPYIFGPLMRQSFFTVGGTAVTDPGGTNLRGPGNGGFDIRRIFSTGVTIQAKTGSNSRQIYAIESADAVDPVTYQWQRSTDDTTWVDISSSDAAYSGYTTNTLTISDNDKGIDDNYIRLKVTDTTPISAFSNPMALEYVGSTVSITTQPSEVTTLAGKPVSFSIAATSTDDVVLSYQWQTIINGSWVNITTVAGWESVNDTSTLLVLPKATITTAKNLYIFRCLVDSDSADNTPLASDAVALFVNAVTVTPTGVVHTGSGNQPIASYNEGATISLDASVTPSNQESVSYVWERANDFTNGPWTQVASGTLTSSDYSNTFTETASIATLGTPAYYRFKYDVPGVVTGATAPQIATANLYRSLTINTQPQNTLVYETQNASFSVVATATSGTETYQWQSYDGSTWNDLVGQTTSSLTISNPSLSDSGNTYRVRITLVGQNPVSNDPNRVGDVVTSSVATLTVDPRPTLAISQQPANVSVFQPDSAVFAVVAAANDGSDITYQWQLSDDQGVSWSNIVGATSSSISTGTTDTASFNDNYYRCVITHPYGTNSPLTSNYAVLTVQTPVISISAQPQNFNITAGIPVTYSVTASVTSGRTINYQWQQSTDGGVTYTNLFEENNSTLVIVGDTNNNGYFYRCQLTSVGAAQVNSNGGSLTLAYLENPTITISRVIDTDTGLSFTRSPIIYASSFRSYIGNGHDVSFWTIRRTSDNVVVYQTIDTLPDGDTVQKIELQAPVLDWGTEYEVQVKYKDSAGFETALSPAETFVTPVVNQPTFEPIPVSLRPTIILNSLEFNSVDYNHTSTSWQVASSGTFAPGVIVYESLNDVSNKITITIPESVTLDASRNYYVRAKINLTAK